LNAENNAAEAIQIDRPSMEVDIACVGFGPATGGFLTTLTKAWNETLPTLPSRAASRRECPCKFSATSGLMI